jgi:hypothetical protein
MQRLVHISAPVTYYLHYDNRLCSGYFILQHWSPINNNMSSCAAAFYFMLQQLSRITYIMSTSAEAITSFFSTGLVLHTLCQNVLNRLLHFSALVSYYLHYFYMCNSGYFIFSTGLVLATLCQEVLQRSRHFTELLSYYLKYTNMCGNGYFILQHMSLITYNLSAFLMQRFSSIYSTGLKLFTIVLHGLQRLLHFSALISYYRNYVKIGCSG